VPTEHDLSYPGSGRACKTRFSLSFHYVAVRTVLTLREAGTPPAAKNNAMESTESREGSGLSPRPPAMTPVWGTVLMWLRSEAGHACGAPRRCDDMVV